MFLEISDSYFQIADLIPSPVEELIIMENNLRFIKSFQQLKPHFQGVFLLQEEGMSNKEIVDKTGYLISNAKAKLSRAKGELALLVN